MDETIRFKLKKFIKELEQYKGRHTEFVTVYVPKDYDLIKIMQHLAQEQGTASNIKSAATRKNVTDALERMIQHLRVVGRTPPRGLAAFAGNIASVEGKSDVRVWSIEPPVDLNLRIYRCDKDFVLDPLREMCESKEIFGLVVLDLRDAHIALLKGKTIVPLLKTHSEVPGKFRAGGQSALRFSRLREGAAHEHFKKVGDYMKEQFLQMKDLRGILLGGPGHTKNEFYDGNYITDQLKQKVIAVKDLSYTEEFGLQELVDKCQDVLAKEEIAGEKAIMQKFFTLLATKQGMVAYGKGDVMKYLELSMVETLLLSDALEDSVIEEFEQKARAVGSTIKIISTETREGVQLRDLGKVAAILRYEANF